MSGETELRPSGWSVDTLHTHVISLLEDRDKATRDARDADLRHLASVIHTIDDRFVATQVLMDEHDIRYQQRFAASQEALTAALSAQKEAVAAALLAADRAVSKAELATEKRFEATNEFRSQLADQAQTFMPRAEAEIRLSSLSEKIDDQRGTRREGTAEVWKSMLSVAALVVSIVVAIVLIIHG